MMTHEEMDNSKDRISNLPDNVLADILSFLPTKDAIATSLLSRRWRYVHNWVTRLEFDHDHPHLLQFPNFLLFVDKVLQTCKSGFISTYKLHFSNKIPRILANFPPQPDSLADLEPIHFNTWMCYPLTRGVHELDICAQVRKPGKLPSAIFGCQTLQVLKIEVNLQLELPEFVCLPNLKDFRLILPSFPDDDSLTRLLLSCSSLEELVVKGYWDSRNPVYILAPHLRILCLILLDWDGCYRSKVVLDVPNLEYLDYVDSFAMHYSIAPVNALKEARVQIVSDHVVCPIDPILSLMSSLSKVEHLCLERGCVQALQSCESSLMLPIFSKLNHLELGSYTHHEWNKILMNLLIYTPFLETLTFLEGLMYSEDVEYVNYELFTEREYQLWSNCDTIPSCLGFHLKRFAIMNYVVTKWELEVVKYFLRNSIALEELVIVCESSVTTECKILLGNTLQHLPRSSMNCSIIIQ